MASIRIEPLERGEGFHFVDQVVGGAIPKQYIPAVEKGVLEAMSQGGVHGYPVVDVQVSCYDGKYHSVDSSEMSFKMAGALAFREAMAKAGPVLLEPVSRLEVTVPATMQGDVLGDLNSRRGRVQGTDSRRRWPAEDHRPGAHRRDPALRRRPALAHRRTGPVPGRARPLRRHAVEPRGAHDQGQDQRELSTADRQAPDQPATGAARARPVSKHPSPPEDSGMTRTPATAVMKLVSPDHRGSTCMCRCDGMPAPAARPRLAPMLMPSGS